MVDDAWKGLAIDQLKDIQRTLERWVDRVSMEHDAESPRRLAEFLNGLAEVSQKIKNLDGKIQDA